MVHFLSILAYLHRRQLGYGFIATLAGFLMSRGVRKTGRYRAALS